jgi:Asp-tRNA(Asn)/Glu-tRNA(Gln) amidotransferase A subunit family amidase
MDAMNRRRFFAWISAGGVTALLAPEVVLAASTHQHRLTEAAIGRAKDVIGLELSHGERQLMAKAVEDHLGNYKKLREIPLPNSVAPALTFSPLLPGRKIETKNEPARFSKVNASRPSSETDLAFLPLTHLAALIRERKISSVELTKMYLGRIKHYDPALRFVITLTEEMALTEARRADDEIARGRYRGPLHGIPYGLKDLFAVKGYRTTWGAAPYKDQMIEEDATVVTRLRDAGAVLLAKTAVGSLAWGDVWFDATTKNPWKLDQGSSGSSAGSASGTAAGCLAVGIGTETLGSVISPSARCGTTGLRPTFGRTSRYGGMALSWSMDKVGVLARSVEDCAVIFDAIRGSDGKDGAVIDAPFPWDAGRNPRSLRIGFDEAAFKEKSDDAEFDQAALTTLKSMGFDLKPVKLPDFPVDQILFILEAEAAAAFDDLTRSNRDDLMTVQVEDAWPNVFRAARFIPAVEYIQANRARTLLMQGFENTVADVDAYVHPSFGGNTLLATNLTGHPSVIVPNGFRKDGTPAHITFTGKLFGEAETLLIAKAYQDETGFHKKHPDLDTAIAAAAEKQAVSSKH